MRRYLIALTLVLVPLASAADGVKLRIHTGGARAVIGTDGFRVDLRTGRRHSRLPVPRHPATRDPIADPPLTSVHRRKKPDRHDSRSRRPRGHKGPHHGGTHVIVVPRDSTTPVSPRPVKPPEPTEPPAETVADPAEPLDPSGSNHLVRARVSGTGAKPWALGEILPANLPQVTLAPGPYGLPDLPPGQIYVRIRHDVLVIDATTRRVIAEHKN